MLQLNLDVKIKVKLSFEIYIKLAEFPHFHSLDKEMLFPGFLCVLESLFSWVQSLTQIVSSLLYQFLIAVITNYLKESTLDNINLLSQSYSDQKCHRAESISRLGCIPSWRLQSKDCFLVLSSIQKPTTCLGPWHPSSIFKASKSGLRLSHRITLMSSLTSLFQFKGPL